MKYHLPKTRKSLKGLPLRVEVTIKFTVATTPGDGLDVLVHSLTGDIIDACTEGHQVGVRINDAKIGRNSIYGRQK